MFNKPKKIIPFLIAIVLFGQLVFAVFSADYTAPFYENRVFATTGIEYGGNDLHKLNEGAHYFGQTMIGWTKFPSFRHALITDLDLPADTEINMHMQERQNTIFTLTTSDPIDFDQLEGAKNFLQAKIDEYNSNTNTKFVLTNVDYEQVEVSRSYGFGALITLILSVMVGFGILFVRKEFFPAKLRL